MQNEECRMKSKNQSAFAFVAFSRRTSVATIRGRFPRSTPVFPSSERSCHYRQLSSLDSRRVSTSRCLQYNERGFTLIEIVVALTVLSLALPALLSSFTMAAKGQARAEGRTTALYLLRYRMAEIELAGYPDIGEEEGEFGENSRYHWHSSTQDVESEEFEGLRQVTVTVSWQELGKEKSVSLSTYVAERQLPQQQQGQGNQQGQGGGG
jgi:general secretion pathway protein I